MRKLLRRLYPRRARASSSTHYRRILLFLLLPIGDTLFTTPTIRALRRRYPHARIDVLVHPTNLGILETNPDIDRVFIHPTRQSWSGWPAYVRFVAMLRARRYDLAVECGPYLWWLATLCGIPYRLDLDMPVYSWFLPIGNRPWSKRHATENMASVVAPLGLQVDTSTIIVQPTEASRAAAARFLEEQEIAQSTPLLGIHPGGEGFRGMKRWGAPQFALTARTLAARHGARVLIFGGSDELDLAEEVARGIGPGVEVVILNGKVSLGVATALLAHCTLFIGNDSAPMHMAAAMGTPTLGIFGPTNPINYRPRGRHVAIVRAGLACSPCVSFIGSTTLYGESRCQDNQCIKQITPQRVIAAAEMLLRRSRYPRPAPTSPQPPVVPAEPRKQVPLEDAKLALAEVKVPAGG